jgi:hypothetical protein
MEWRRTIACLILVLTCGFAGYVAAQPDETTNYENCQTIEKLTKLLRSDSKHYPAENASDRAETTDCRPPKWYAVFKRIEGWQLIVAVIGIGIIGWQSWETRKSAKASEENIKLIAGKERARVRIIVDKPWPIQVGVRCYCDVFLKNIGETTAFLEDAQIYGALGPEEMAVDTSNYFKLPFVGDIDAKSQSVTYGVPMLRLDADDMKGLGNGTLFIHCFGFAKYRDVFERAHHVRLHLRWRIQRSGGENWELAGQPEENSDT